jgi:hypothetical protein
VVEAGGGCALVVVVAAGGGAARADPSVALLSLSQLKRREKIPWRRWRR